MNARNEMKRVKLCAQKTWRLRMRDFRVKTSSQRIFSLLFLWEKNIRSISWRYDIDRVIRDFIKTLLRKWGYSDSSILCRLVLYEIK